MLYRALLLSLLLLGLTLPGLAADDPADSDGQPAASGEESDTASDPSTSEGPDAAPAEEAADSEAAPADSGENQMHTCYAPDGEPWEPSPTRVEAVFSERGQLKRARFLNLGYFVITLRLFAERRPDLRLKSVSILDYATFGSGAEQMLQFDLENQNVWLVHTDAKLKGTRPPYFLGFSDEKSARDYAAQHGGKVMGYDKAVMKIAGELNRDQGDDAFGEQLMQ